MANGDLILYSTDDGLAQFTLREMDGLVWLTQLEMAELYQISKQNIGKYIQAFIADGELAEGAVVNQNFTTAAYGKEYLKRRGIGKRHLSAGSVRASEKRLSSEKK